MKTKYSVGNLYDKLIKCQNNIMACNRHQIPLAYEVVTRNYIFSLARVALVPAELTQEALISISLWYKEEISNKRCVSQIVGSVLAADDIRRAGHDVGTAGTSLSEWLAQNLFNLPKAQALGNAYRLLGLSYICSNADINAAYFKRAPRYHPEMGGNKDDWIKLQCALQIIKESRGEGCTIPCKKGLLLLSKARERFQTIANTFLKL